MSMTREELEAQAARDQLYEDLAHKCTCTPLSARPCDGLLAGGTCDELHLDRDSDLDDEEDLKDFDRYEG